MMLPVDDTGQACDLPVPPAWCGIFNDPIDRKQILEWLTEADSADNAAGGVARCWRAPRSG
jgi:hypothetical protein